MKTAQLPTIRVEPALRADLESVLEEGESLTGFVEEAVRSAVQYRRVQAEFLARGEAAWQAYRRTGESVAADEVFDRLEHELEERRRQLDN